MPRRLAIVRHPFAMIPPERSVSSLLESSTAGQRGVRAARVLSGPPMPQIAVQAEWDASCSAIRWQVGLPPRGACLAPVLVGSEKPWRLQATHHPPYRPVACRFVAVLHPAPANRPAPVLRRAPARPPATGPHRAPIQPTRCPVGAVVRRSPVHVATVLLSLT
jgi:hypothetical protein